MRLLFLFLLCSASVHAQLLVMPGDHPDPSVVKIGDTYWASATTSNWFPAFPIMSSKDLVKWEMQGYVFEKLPAWADYYFWAPEISYEKGKVYIYYAAHKKGGNLCIGVASANNPAGPYKDHGPLMCEVDGSIDAFPMRDENGKLYLIWKEDANSVQKPTPIWAMQMNEERTALIGEKKELFRNDKLWEGNLVEGVSMIKHGGYFYAFYAASACCGKACTYGIGIARSKSLLGPWEKYQRNPVLIEDKRWKCPGHGTPVEKDGKYFFLYHAYDTATTVFTGRQGLLAEFNFTNDGWIEFVKQKNTGEPTTPERIKDEFNGSKLSNLWQWTVFQPVNYQLKGGRLRLSSLDAFPMTFMGQKTYTGNYSATALLDLKNSTAGVGVAAIGDENNAVAAVYQKGVISFIMLKDGKESILSQDSVGRDFEKSPSPSIRIEVTDGYKIIFLYGRRRKLFFQPPHNPINGSYLPPWDRAVRAGVVVRGKGVGAFEEFELFNIKPTKQPK